MDVSGKCDTISYMMETEEKYLTFTPNTDDFGFYIQIWTSREALLNWVKEEREDYPDVEFVRIPSSSYQGDHFGNASTDLQEHERLIVKVEEVIPKPKTVIQEWEI